MTSLKLFFMNVTAYIFCRSCYGQNSIYIIMTMMYTWKELPGTGAVLP